MKSLLFLFLSLLFACAQLSAQEKPRLIIVNAQQMIEGGEFEEAIAYLDNASNDNPRNSLILALYGQALYENKEIEKAELQFMDALRVDPLNEIAKSYIEVIRETSAASVSEQSQLIEEVAWDKIGDLVVMAFAFMLGTVLSNYVKKIASWHYSSKSRDLFREGEYEDFADLLEIQLSSNELKSLRQSLKFMLEHKSLDESVDILNRYVNSESNLDTLTRMIRLSNAASQS